MNSNGHTVKTRTGHAVYMISRALLILSSVYAQPFSHEFHDITRNSHFGAARDVAIHPSGDVIVAYSGGICRTYEYSDHRFESHTLNKLDDLNPNCIEVSSSGFVFINSQFTGGVALYAYSDGALIRQAQTTEVGYASTISVANDSTVFIASSSVGISAYDYRDSSLTPRANYQVDGEIRTLVAGPQNTVLASVVPDGLLLLRLGNDSLWQINSINQSCRQLCVSDQDVIFALWSTGELEAFQLSDSTLNSIAITEGSPPLENVHDMDTGPGGRIYLNHSEQGISVFTLSDSSLTLVDFIGDEGESLHSRSRLAVREDNTIIATDHDNGLFSYTQMNGGYTPVATVNDGGSATGMGSNDDTTIFLANGQGGVRVYTFDSNELQGTCVFDQENWSALDVNLNSQGTAFVSANMHLSAFSFTVDSLSLLAQQEMNGSINEMSLINDSTIVVGVDHDKLAVMLFQDTAFVELATVPVGFWNQFWGVGSDESGRIYTLDRTANLVAYQFEDSSLTLLGETQLNWDYGALGVRNDGVIFVTAYPNLLAYSFDGISFNLIDEIGVSGDYEGQGLCFSPDGTIFLADGYQGLKAFSLEGSEFTQLAQLDSIGICTDVFTLTGENVWVAQKNNGMRLYKFQTALDTKESPGLTTRIELMQNYPNPFNPSTTISYGLPEESNVSLVIYDVRGQVVQTLESGHQPAGWSDVVWNGQTSDGKTISTGIYFGRLEAGEYSQVIKMLYLK